MHKETYVLSCKEKYRIDGRCQAAWGDSETESQNRIFSSCDMVACRFFCTVPLQGEWRTVCNVSNCIDELWLPGEKSITKYDKDTMPKNTLHPSEWGTSGVSCLTACIKKDGLMMHKAFLLTLSILSLAGHCCSHGHRPLTRELFWQLWFTGTAKRGGAWWGNQHDRNQCFACWLSC